MDEISQDVDIHPQIIWCLDIGLNVAKRLVAGFIWPVNDFDNKSFFFLNGNPNIVNLVSISNRVQYPGGEFFFEIDTGSPSYFTSVITHLSE